MVKSKISCVLGNLWYMLPQNDETVSVNMKQEYTYFSRCSPVLPDEVPVSHHSTGSNGSFFPTLCGYPSFATNTLQTKQIHLFFGMSATAAIRQCVLGSLGGLRRSKKKLHLTLKSLSMVHLQLYCGAFSYILKYKNIESRKTIAIVLHPSYIVYGVQS